ncbi:MAG: hypothetical protein J7M27_01405 [Candidatus Latescibacteria bacterium]|nr:hypothetical protein [Candidatus Latescibacterota bacterium]
MSLKHVSQNRKRPPLWLQVLIIAITLTALAVAIFLGNQTHREARKMAAEQFNQQQLILARSAATGIEAYYKELRNALSGLTKLPSIQQMSPECLRCIQHVYWGFPPRTSIRLLDSKGFLRFIYPFEGWRKTLIGRNYSEEDFFHEARETGQIAVCGMAINEQGERRLRIAVPVYLTTRTETVSVGDMTGIISAPIDPDKPESGGFQGVLIGSLDQRIFARDFISTIVSGETGYAYLLSEDGTFVVHQEEEFAGRNAFEVRKKRNPDLSYEAIEQIQRKMMAGEEGVGRYVSGWHRGQRGEIEKLVAYAPVHINGSIWSVAVCAPVREVERIIETTKCSDQIALWFVILILILGGGSFFVVSYRWSRSLEREVVHRTKELKETNRELVRAEEGLEHLNSVLKAIRNVNQLIVVEKGRDRLLQKVCDILIEARGYEAAWLGFLKDDKPFARVVGSGFGEDVPNFCEHIMGSEPPPCIKNVLDQKDCLLIVDQSGACGDCFFRNACTGKEVAIIRVEHADRLFGVLAVLSVADVVIDEEEKGLLKEVAGDIGIALHNMELEEGRRRAEERLEHLNSVLKAIRNVNQLIVVESDQDRLLRKSCDILLKSRGYDATWLGLLKDDETFATVVGSGSGENISRFCERVMGGEPPLCIKNALTQKTAPVVMEKSRMCEDCFFKNACAGKEVAIIQVEHAGRLLGVLAVLSARDVVIDEEEKGLLKEVAWDIAIGLHNTELEKGRLRAEEQIRRYNEELEELVHERMARIQELERQQVENEKLAAAGRMAARIAHEINNPLAGIKNSFLLIKDAISEDYPYYEYVGRIEKEIDRIARIVRQMFDLYRPDREESREFPVDEAIRDVVALLEASRREYKATLEVDTGDASALVVMPEALLRQILYNVLQNAIEASPPGGVVRIAVALAEDVLTLTISDRGSGIPEEVGHRIFEPFFTTKSGLTTGGLGLGLSVSKNIVESLGGSLDFESAAGQGTVFNITLPFNRM